MSFFGGAALLWSLAVGKIKASEFALQGGVCCSNICIAQGQGQGIGGGFLEDP
jgi:hypothetical protein